MAEKVRYYLEQSIPELEDLKRKGLFDKHEITMIMRRRTDFEHRIQGRGSKPRDFLKYVEFEGNLEKLRKKRYNRLNKVGLVETKPSISDWAGVRRIMFVFDRATRRYPGDTELWSHYLQFAKENGAIKVIYKVYSRLLQLQPRNVDAWLSAAKYEFEENANAKGARVLFQRGLRLNPESLELWLSYAQFELTYISKLLARRKVLGLITEKQQQEALESEQDKLAKSITESALGDDNDDFNADKIELPTAAEMKDELNHLPEADMNMLGNPETNPALKGDVALTIFDLCVPSILKTIPEYSTVINPQDKVFEIVERFLSLIDKFEDLNRDYLMLHVLNYVQKENPQDLRTLFIDITLPIRNVSRTSENLAEALQLSVNKFIAYKLKLKDASERTTLTNMFINKLNNQFLANTDNENEKVDALLKAIITKCRNV
ncbi:U3 snoRNP protein [Spathaspora passalidarum NRRL Y-27907]|uniref:U3 snoRNP protein n=1 Tax=Spathaspora passalidarum (strain NRRL Y-27907 / 11-Y1) TaxID=619300 RepID=G3ATD0_SPAPN|nr:U3 snoRNP protein [Spathaspora passalidarum NRRL Y-27907]EGW30893.1 U3 snoRNP protein [Spathaspora passalidarum NRRL Y-27907]